MRKSSTTPSRFSSPPSSLRPLSSSALMPLVVWSLKVVIRRTTVLPTTRPRTAVILMVSRMIDTSNGSAVP